MRSTRPQSAHRSQQLAARAASMRGALTGSEALLWQALSGSKLGVGFRRQFVVGEFIADFAAPSARLIVEVDGEYHADRGRADARRDRALSRLGWQVLRFSNQQVTSELPLVLLRILEAIG